jgi:hypothetical protein
MPDFKPLVCRSSVPKLPTSAASHWVIIQMGHARHLSAIKELTAWKTSRALGHSDGAVHR